MARVTPSQARKHALFHLHTKTRTTFNPLGVGSGGSLSLGDSIDFLDVAYLGNDDPPLRCFEIRSSDLIVGVIAISGSTFLGSTLVSLRITTAEPFVIRFAALRNVIRQHLGVNTETLPDTDIFPIAYSYPKFGLGTRLPDDSWLVVDYFDGVPFTASLEELETDDSTQGIAVWSFWDAFPQAGPTEDAWKSESDFIDSLFPTDGPDLPVSVLGDPLVPDVGVLETDLVTSLERRLSERPPMQRILSLPVPLIGQITNVHCAPASLSMIYQYLYRSSLSQNEAGEAMDILPNGSTVSGQVRGFREKVGDDFEVTLDRTPTWDELFESIQAGLPAKSGIRGHARTAVGVREDIYINPLTGQTDLTEQLLLVNDPEPVGTGSQIWENIRTAILRDFIFISRR